MKENNRTSKKTRGTDEKAESDENAESDEKAERECAGGEKIRTRVVRTRYPF